MDGADSIGRVRNTVAAFAKSHPKIKVRVEQVTDEFFMRLLTQFAAGVAPGDRVALMAGSGVEWVRADYAIWLAGAVSVPIPAAAVPAEVEWILQDSGAVAAFTGDDRQYGLVARAAERIVLVGSGLDPKSICPAEAGYAELGRAAYVAALDGYASGRPEGMAAWIAHCGKAVELGVRESTAVCEALQRGAA